MRAVIYTRVSSKEQVEGYSLAAQHEACARLIEENGWTLIETYSDRGESARTADRPQFQAMLERLAEAPVDALVVHRLDRLARSLEDHVAVRALLKQHGVQLVSVSESLEESASGKLVEGILASINEFYSANLSQEIRKGQTQKASEGLWPTRAPVGYRNVRKDTTRRGEAVMVLDEEQAPLVRESFERYATSTYSLHVLYREMRDRGLKRDALSKFATMLKNPIYVGKVVWNGVEYEGRHEPIVSREIFDRVQEVATTHANGTRTRVHNHYLKPLLRCACGGRMTFMEAKGRYPYFFCLRTQKDRGCDAPFVPAESLEDQVAELYRGIVLRPELRDEIERALEEEIAAREESRAKTTQFLARKLERLAKERTKLLQAFYGDAITLELLKSEQKRIDSETAEVEAKLKSASAQVERSRDIIRMALTLLEDCHESYLRASEDVRRLWNEVVFERLTIKDRKIIGVEHAEPFRSLFFSGPGLSKGNLVEVMGLEPTTSTLRTVRGATR